MRNNKNKILAATVAVAVGAGGVHAAREILVREGLERGRAVVVAAPAGRCVLKDVYVNGKKTFINVSVTSSKQDASPSGLHVLTASGDVPVEMGNTGKGAPGLSIVGGDIKTADLLSPLPVNPPTPGGTVIADTPEGAAVCGSFVVVPYAGNGSNQGQTIG